MFIAAAKQMSVCSDVPPFGNGSKLWTKWNFWAESFPAAMILCCGLGPLHPLLFQMPMIMPSAQDSRVLLQGKGEVNLP